MTIEAIQRFALHLAIAGLAAAFAGCGGGKSKLAGQNPSPMEERTRQHLRPDVVPFNGTSHSIRDILPRPVALFVDTQRGGTAPAPLLIHFHGRAEVMQSVVLTAVPGWHVAVVNLGAGSSVYEKPFRDSDRFTVLLAAIRSRLPEKDADRPIYLSGFSAGYGALRAILSQPAQTAAVTGTLLLDGLHTDYSPERLPLAQGGTLNMAKLEPFIAFARTAIAGKKRMYVSNSTVFPGTFASTTECVDAVLAELGLRRAPVLKWGPVGMQQLSEVKKNGLLVQGFAGNSAPDHVDHLYGLGAFLKELLRLELQTE